MGVEKNNGDLVPENKKEIFTANKKCLYKETQFDLQKSDDQKKDMFKTVEHVLCKLGLRDLRYSVDDNVLEIFNGDKKYSIPYDEDTSIINMSNDIYDLYKKRKI